MNRIPPGLHSVLLTALMAAMTCPDCVAWGRAGHEAIGLLALQSTSTPARRTLQRISGTDDLERMAEACNWPDLYKETPEGAWSEPQHYVNLPLGAAHYEARRDCPDGLCVAGAIVRYVAELKDTALPDDQRQRAWVRVCHFVADAHQPFHTGYGSDRGGFDQLIVFNGEEMTLHHYWDYGLINFNYPDGRDLARDLALRVAAPIATEWKPANVDDWVEESHRLVDSGLYPAEKEISREFAAANWLLALDQMAKASARLALVLNKTLVTEE